MKIASVNCHRPSLLALFLLVVLANSATAAEPKKPLPEEPSCRSAVHWKPQNYNELVRTPRK